MFGACKSELQSDLDVNGLMNFGYVELRLIIEWSRKVPGRFLLSVMLFVLLLAVTKITTRLQCHKTEKQLFIIADLNMLAVI